MSTQMMNKVIADYFKTQPVQRAWLFGSFARGEQRPWSDVDILVEFDKEKPIGLLINFGASKLEIKRKYRLYRH